MTLVSNATMVPQDLTNDLNQLDLYIHSTTKEVMLSAFSKAAYSWQLKTIVHLSKMASKKWNLAPSAVFLCRPTGGGLSLVRDTYTVLVHYTTPLPFS
jgi:hypothetical protein